MCLYLFIFYLLTSGLLIHNTSSDSLKQKLGDFLQLETVKCPDNEIYFRKDYSPICDHNCQDIQRECIITRKQAVAGCYCRLGFYRNLQQKCIPKRDCRYDCFPNEKAMFPKRKDSEMNCNGTVMSQEGKCVCQDGFCRNKTGACQIFNNQTNS